LNAIRSARRAEGALAAKNRPAYVATAFQGVPVLLPSLGLRRQKWGSAKESLMKTPARPAYR